MHVAGDSSSLSTVTTLPARWTIALGTSVPTALLLLVSLSVVVKPAAVGVGLGAAFSAVAAGTSIARVRRRSLSVSETGLEVQRDKYVLTAPWSAVVGVAHRRIWGLLAVDELLLAHSHPVGRSSKGRAVAVPRRLPGHPASRRIQVSVYDKAWRQGPIGDHLRASGVLDSDVEH